MRITSDVTIYAHLTPHLHCTHPFISIFHYSSVFHCRSNVFTSTVTVLLLTFLPTLNRIFYYILFLWRNWTGNTRMSHDIRVRPKWINEWSLGPLTLLNIQPGGINNYYKQRAQVPTCLEPWEQRSQICYLSPHFHCDHGRPILSMSYLQLVTKLESLASIACVFWFFMYLHVPYPSSQLLYLAQMVWPPLVTTTVSCSDSITTKFTSWKYDAICWFRNVLHEKNQQGQWSRLWRNSVKEFVLFI